MRFLFGAEVILVVVITIGPFPEHSLLGVGVRSNRQLPLRLFVKYKSSSFRLEVDGERERDERCNATREKHPSILSTRHSRAEQQKPDYPS